MSPLDLLQGKMGANSQPIHPLTVHLPLTFLLGAATLDVLTYIHSNHYTLTRLTDIAPLSTLTQLSYLSLVLGLLTALPALATGIAEMKALISTRGRGKLDLSDRVIRTTVFHAGTMDSTIAASAANWYLRRNAEGYASEAVNAAISAGVLGGLVIAGFLGGALVYGHGVGVQRMGAGKQERVREIKGKIEGKKGL